MHAEVIDFGLPLECTVTRRRLLHRMLGRWVSHLLHEFASTVGSEAAVWTCASVCAW